MIKVKKKKKERVCKAFLSQLKAGPACAANNIQQHPEFCQCYHVSILAHFTADRKNIFSCMRSRFMAIFTNASTLFN